MNEIIKKAFHNDFDAPDHNDYYLTEHWRHETVLELLRALKAVEFSNREQANDAIGTALSYLNDDDWSWKCRRCDAALIECDCKGVVDG